MSPGDIANELYLIGNHLAKGGSTNPKDLERALGLLCMAVARMNTQTTRVDYHLSSAKGLGAQSLSRGAPVSR
jgi:hypothetical protein